MLDFQNADVLKCTENWMSSFSVQLHMSGTGLNCAAAVLFPLGLILSFIIGQKTDDKLLFFFFNTSHDFCWFLCLVVCKSPQWP